jgi:hypothetical protein
MHTTVGGKFTNDSRLQHINHILDPPHKYKAIRKLLKSKLIAAAKQILPRIPKQYREKYNRIAGESAWHFIHSIQQSKHVYPNDTQKLQTEYTYRIKCLLLHTLHRTCPPICVCHKLIDNYTQFTNNIKITEYDSMLNTEFDTANTPITAHKDTHTNIQVKMEDEQAYSNDTNNIHIKHWLDATDPIDAHCIPIYTEIINTLTTEETINSFIHKYTTSSVESFHSLVRSIVNVRHEYRKRFKYYIMLSIIRHNYIYDTCTYLQHIFDKLNMPFTQYMQDVIHNALDKKKHKIEKKL